MKYFDSIWPYSMYQFALWRFVFGAYLTFYALWLWPYATVLFSHEGMLNQFFFEVYFPSPLLISSDPWMVYALMVLHVVGALGIWLGIYRHYAAVLYLFSMASFLQWNLFVEDPALSFVNMAVALTLLIPATEPLQLRPAKSKEKWEMPFFVYLTAMVTMGAGYTISGIDKLGAEGWRVGDAMYYLYHLSIAYDVWYMDILRAQPAWLITIETYAAVTSMLIALPLFCIKQTRLFIWLVLTGMFVFTLIAFDLWQVSIGMLLYHALVFDKAWIKPKRGSLQLYYDGECPFCQAFVRLVQHEDTDAQITATPLKRAADGSCADSIMVINGKKECQKAAAVQELFAHLGGMYRVAAWVGVAVPTVIANAVYDFVGRRRLTISKYCK